MLNWLKIKAYIAAFWRFPLPEKWLLIQSAALLPWVALGLRLFGFNRIQAILASFAPPMAHQERVSEQQIAQAYRSAFLVEKTTRHGLIRANCLQRSLLLWFLLLRRGIYPDLRIGCKLTSKFEAHAWLELDGHIINDSVDVLETYAVFPRAFNLPRPSLSWVE